MPSRSPSRTRQICGIKLCAEYECGEFYAWVLPNGTRITKVGRRWKYGGEYELRRDLFSAIVAYRSEVARGLARN